MVLGLESAGGTGAEGVESVVGAGDDIGDAESAIGAGLDPELIGFHPLLKVVDGIDGGGLLDEADPEAGGGGFGIAAVGNG